MHCSKEMSRAADELGRGARGVQHPRNGARAAATAWLYKGAQLGPETRRITITSTSLGLGSASGCYALGTLREIGSTSTTSVFLKCGLPGPGRTKEKFQEEARIQDRIATCSDTAPVVINAFALYAASWSTGGGRAAAARGGRGMRRVHGAHRDAARRIVTTTTQTKASVVYLPVYIWFESC